jgi:hypothetical protein
MVKALRQGLKLQYRPVEALPLALRLAIQALSEQEKALTPHSPASASVSCAVPPLIASG